MSITIYLTIQVGKFSILVDHQRFKAEKINCKNIIEKGEARRIYIGNKNRTRKGTPCRKWSEVDQEYGDYEGVGDHNYCRNPGNSRSKEWCYITKTKKWGSCGVRTCGKRYFLF